MIYLVLITAVTVSLDSFICGLSLSIGKSKKIPLILIVTITVLLMCLITNYATYLLKDVLSEKTASFGGLILIGVGVFNLLKKEKEEKDKKDRSFIIQSLIAGFAVGLDGAIANFSLALMGMAEFYVPIIIALTHGVMIGLSVGLSNTALFKKISKYKFIPPIILILLGIYKAIGIFL